MLCELCKWWEPRPLCSPQHWWELLLSGCSSVNDCLSWLEGFYNTRQNWSDAAHLILNIASNSLKGTRADTLFPITFFFFPNSAPASCALKLSFYPSNQCDRYNIMHVAWWEPDSTSEVLSSLGKQHLEPSKFTEYSELGGTGGIKGKIKVSCSLYSRPFGLRDWVTWSSCLSKLEGTHVVGKNCSIFCHTSFTRGCRPPQSDSAVKTLQAHGIP